MHYLHHKLSMIYLYREIFHHIANMHQTVTSSIKGNLTPPQSEILRALRNNKLTTCAFSIKNSHSNKHQYRMATLPSNIEIFIHSIISILLSPTNEFWKPRHIHFPTKQPKEKLVYFYLNRSIKSWCHATSLPIKIVILSLAWGWWVGVLWGFGVVFF